MKPFIVLALCCSFFSSRATPLPFEFLDCDDPDVFKAVDTALKKYNGDRATGNQFALYMVMEAKRTAGPDTQFYMKYRIHETTCAAEENKLWQDCDYKVPAEAKTGECTAQVHMNNAEKTSNVSQDCKIFPATPKITLTEATCLGCFHPIPSDSSEVSEILKQAIQKFNRHSAEPAFFKLVEIKEAKRQRVGKCDAKAYQNLHAEIIDIASQCKLPAEDTVIPATRSGCPKTIPKDSPELKELLKVSMEKYNSESNDDFYYKGGEIEAATVQVVAGQNYHLVFAIRKTNCSKTEFEKFNEDCEATSDSAPLPCEAQIHVIPWENKIFPQVNCSKERSMVDNDQTLWWTEIKPMLDSNCTPCIQSLSPVERRWGNRDYSTVLLRRPPGFTPFRSFATLDQPNEISCSDKNEEERQRPGKEMRKDGGQEPEGEDRPEPLLPRCPGKPWKQIMDLPAPSGFPREFTNEDLLPSAVENIDPATESSTPPQNKDFDISDALL
uniref:Kininogen 1 n=1 Tax=Aquila chrysaetos chrysaetos TaxID=223781 RepID=A0A663DR44_AQUCH